MLFCASYNCEWGLAVGDGGLAVLLIGTMQVLDLLSRNTR